MLDFNINPKNSLGLIRIIDFTKRKTAQAIVIFKCSGNVLIISINIIK